MLPDNYDVIGDTSSESESDAHKLAYDIIDRLIQVEKDLAALIDGLSSGRLDWRTNQYLCDELRTANQTLRQSIDQVINASDLIDH